MARKLIILGTSTSGKSTLMRYLRKRMNIDVVEMDEEIVRLNGGSWPSDDDYKNSVLVPKITNNILDRNEAVYISSFVPEDLVKEAKKRGFTILLMDVSLEELKSRNKKRMTQEKYESVKEYFDIQMAGFERLKRKGLIDQIIDGHRPTEEIAEDIEKLIT